MSRSELHNWECAIEKLSGDNADKMLAIAQDIYNTAFVRGKNYMSLEQTELNPSYNSIKTELEPCEDYISRADAIKIIKEHPSIVGNRSTIIQKIVDLPSLTPKAYVSDMNVGEILEESDVE